MHEIHNTHDSQALKNKVLSADVAKTGFLLDGYPRTVEQAKLLKQHGVPIDKIVLVDPSQQATCLLAHMHAHMHARTDTILAPALQIVMLPVLGRCGHGQVHSMTDGS